MKRLLFILPVLAFVGLLAVFFLGLGRDPRALPSAFLDKPLPVFATAPVRPGDAAGVANTDFGGQPMLLNVYASWCGPCRVEQPVLMRLRAEGVPVHGLDWKERQPGAGLRWLSQMGDPYLKVGDDTSGRAGIEIGVAGVPETFVIDKRGRVRYRHAGALTPEVWETKIGPLMEQLRAES